MTKGTCVCLCADCGRSSDARFMTHDTALINAPDASECVYGCVFVVCCLSARLDSQRSSAEAVVREGIVQEWAGNTSSSLKGIPVTERSTSLSLSHSRLPQRIVSPRNSLLAWPICPGLAWPGIVRICRAFINEGVSECLQLHATRRCCARQTTDSLVSNGV